MSSNQSFINLGVQINSFTTTGAGSKDGGTKTVSQTVVGLAKTKIGKATNDGDSINQPNDKGKTDENEGTLGGTKGSELENGASIIQATIINDGGNFGTPCEKRDHDLMMDGKEEDLAIVTPIKWKCLSDSDEAFVHYVDQEPQPYTPDWFFINGGAGDCSLKSQAREFWQMAKVDLHSKEPFDKERVLEIIKTTIQDEKESTY